MSDIRVCARILRNARIRKAFSGHTVALDCQPIMVSCHTVALDSTIRYLHRVVFFGCRKFRHCRMLAISKKYRFCMYLCIDYCCTNGNIRKKIPFGLSISI